MIRLRFILLLLLLLARAVPARAQLPQVRLSGVSHTMTGAVNPRGELHIFEVRKAGANIPPGDLRIRTNSSGQWLDPVDGLPGFNVPRGAQIRIFSTAPGYNSCRLGQACDATWANGVWVPTDADATTANLDDIVSVASVATTGMVFKSGGTALPGLYGTLNVVGGTFTGSSGIGTLTLSGGGSVTSFSAGNLSPLFTSSVANSTTTPALTFTLSSQSPNRVLAGPATGSAAGPTFRALVAADMPDLSGTYAAASHAHPESDVTGLVSDLAGKAGTVHTHTASQITDFNTAVDARISYPVSSVFGRTGAVTLQSADVTTALGFTPVTNARTVNGHALSADVTVSKSDVGLGNAENTALSTWAGSTNLTTLGAVTVGTWQGTVIGSAYGGAGSVSGILKANGSGTVSQAASGTDYVAPGAATGSGLTMTTARLLGRTTASSGAIEEINVGSGLSLSGGTLSATGGGGTTVNSTDGVLPYRSNSTTFADSPVARLGANSISIGNVGSFAGLSVVGNAAGSGLTLSALSSMSSEAMTIATKGTATLTLTGSTVVLNGLADMSAGGFRSVTSSSGMESNISRFGTTYGSAHSLFWTAGVPSASPVLGLRRNADAVLEVNNGTSGQWGGLKAGFYGSATNTASDGLTVGTRSSGTPAAGLGAGIGFTLDSTTTANRAAGGIVFAWTDATDATRTSVFQINLVSNAAALANAAKFDLSSTAGDSGFWLWSADKGAVVRVLVGPTDSAGSGFRLLRISN